MNKLACRKSEKSVLNETRRLNQGNFLFLLEAFCHSALCIFLHLIHQSRPFASQILASSIHQVFLLSSVQRLKHEVHTHAFKTSGVVLTIGSNMIDQPLNPSVYQFSENVHLRVASSDGDNLNSVSFHRLTPAPSKITADVKEASYLSSGPIPIS